MRGYSIIVSADPRGKRQEGRVSGALLPGTIVQAKVSAGVGDDGRITYEAATPGADGGATPLIVLLEDNMQGRLPTTAYADGERCFVYEPQEGEEINLLTDGPIAFGDKLIVKNATGKVLTTTGTPARQPFQAMETITAVANSLVWARTNAV